jgi:hypothetical protein
MTDKFYPVNEQASMTAEEPAVAYRTGVSTSDRWNPNVPFHCTQEEFLEHIHRIEQGKFTPWEEDKKEFEIWKKEYLASRLK